MTRTDAIPYVAYVVDDAGAGRELGADMHAIVRYKSAPPVNGWSFSHSSRLVGWQCGFEPLFVAVHSYLDVAIDDSNAEEMAAEYLAEIGWFSDGIIPADYIL